MRVLASIAPVGCETYPLAVVRSSAACPLIKAKSVKRHYGNITETLRKHYENIMKTLWKHYGNIMETLWKHYGNIMETL